MISIRGCWNDDDLWGSVMFNFALFVDLLCSNC